ncbi:Holliday junction ATP-dependent DNA helicase RuvA [Geothrix oryzae]|uniref:Holliday junction branch migration complex subunit RuvA n=1 Tax=Geothrix oryzae TaxID=2927975 RepID=A0ABM8DPX5_9BACT|nr:Holliday junction branch migration protein RuvA [Geothrix oryzae]BDU69000.1 Holliday junction ATP-dependent DNA helicase RuvA [Geothrix oryzae]
MIGRLRGELIQKLPNLALVECGGVGYAAAISLSTYGLLPEAGSQVVLHTELLVRENEIGLLGFASPQERELYRMLVKVDGVGPKMALAALGALSLEDLVQALRGRDVKTLTRIPGVGKKTAEKMCFELSEKMGGLTGLDGLVGTPSGDPWEGSLRSALTNLGFKEEMVLPVVAELRASKPALPEAIRQALKALQR